MEREEKKRRLGSSTTSVELRLMASRPFFFTAQMRVDSIVSLYNNGDLSNSP